MNKKAKSGIWLIIAIIVIIGIWWGTSKKPVEEEKVYKIGVIVPLSGATAHLGTSIVSGIEFAAEEINSKGGINGHNMKIIAQDGKLEGKESVNAVNYLLSIEDPDIFSILFAPPTMAVSPVLMGKKKPMIYEAFTYGTVQENQYAFKANFDPVTGCEKLIRYAKERGKYEKLGLMMASGEWTDLCLKGMKKVEPDIKEYRYEFGEKDFRTYLTKAYNDGVDALMTIPVFSPINLFKQVSELGYPITIFCATASESLYPKVVQSASNKALNGTLGIDIIPQNLTETQFAKDYGKLHPNADNVEYTYAALGYEQVMYISEAMKNCEPGDSECLTEELEEVSGYRTVLGSHGFKDRILQLDTEIYEWKGGKDGGWEIVE